MGESPNKHTEPLVRPKSRSATEALLHAALAREQTLLRDKAELSQRQVNLAQEFEHRLVNGLQLISSLLTLQSRTASPEASAQLVIAANRVSALGRVHRRLHLLDHQDSVQFKQYLEQLCVDLSDLLFQSEAGCRVTVTGAEIEIPTAFAIPLGFIVNELVTNSVKYANDSVTVQVATDNGYHSLSVSDDGPGLPPGFKPEASKGLGMKIVSSLVTQIGGELRITSGGRDQGTCFTVTFAPQKLRANGI